MKDTLLKVMKETEEIAEKLLDSEPTVNQLVSEIKSIIMKSAMRKAIPVESCTDVAAKLVVMVTLMK